VIGSALSHPPSGCEILCDGPLDAPLSRTTDSASRRVAGFAAEELHTRQEQAVIVGPSAGFPSCRRLTDILKERLLLIVR
jgi:hypothetical protein